jgi:hypothetical protein
MQRKMLDGPVEHRARVIPDDERTLCHEGGIHSELFLSILCNSMIAYFYCEHLLAGSYVSLDRIGTVLSACSWTILLSALGLIYMLVRSERPLTTSTTLLFFITTTLATVVLCGAVPEAATRILVLGLMLFISIRQFVCICEIVRHRKVGIENYQVVISLGSFLMRLAAEPLEEAFGGGMPLLHLLAYASALLLGHYTMSEARERATTQIMLYLLCIYLLTAYVGMSLVTDGQVLSADLSFIAISTATTILSLLLALYLGASSFHAASRRRFAFYFLVFCSYLFFCILVFSTVCRSQESLGGLWLQVKSWVS